MDIQRIDRNYDTGFELPEDVEWYSVEEAPFAVHGVSFCAEEGLYRRLPRAVAEATSEGVAALATKTSGGRVRFATDSPYVVVRVEEVFEAPVPHYSIAGRSGLTLFRDGRYEATVMPSYAALSKADPSHGGAGRVVFAGICRPFAVDGVYQAQLYMPLGAKVYALQVGLKRGCTLQAAKPYTHTRPILFYGSSITQGGNASKAGDDYISRVTRALDCDYINLGFSGSAKAEPAMREYIAGQKPSVFVLDYDHNAPDADYLRQTHFPLYEAVRRQNPDTPIVLMTMPTVEGREKRPRNKARRAVIWESYDRAKAMGDKNVYLIDCYGCFGGDECGTADGLHPDSLGFFRMAQRVLPVLDGILNGNTKE